MIDLRFDTIGAYFIHKIKEHPQEYMRNHNIKYKSAESVSIADCWIFYDCEYTCELPPFIEVMK